MSDFSKLTTNADKGAPPTLDAPKAEKGTPPAPEQTNNNLSKPPRDKPVVKAKIEFSVPKTILDDFAQEAGKRFGFKKGSKSDLFMAMWNEYKDRVS